MTLCQQRAAMNSNEQQRAAMNKQACPRSDHPPFTTSPLPSDQLHSGTSESVLRLRCFYRLKLYNIHQTSERSKECTIRLGQKVLLQTLKICPMLPRLKLRILCVYSRGGSSDAWISLTSLFAQLFATNENTDKIFNRRNITTATTTKPSGCASQLLHPPVVSSILFPLAPALPLLPMITAVPLDGRVKTTSP